MSSLKAHNDMLGNLRGVFPDNASFVICLAYMGTFVMQGLLTTASQSVGGGYSYNTTTAVMTAECIKLATAFGLYVQEHGLTKFQREFQAHQNLLRLYFVPAGLYCLYNNLAFINLANYDPTSYYLLLQFRVVVTGVVFQVLFKQRLSQKQWASLVILTCGCFMKEYGSGSHKEASVGIEAQRQADFYFHTGLIMVQVFCSCFAGVYNEKLLKGDNGEAPVMLQNCYMYLDSIVCNILFIMVRGELGSAFSAQGLSSMLQPVVVLVCCNNAMIGIITSLFLKKLNSVVKVYASAIELIATAILSWMLFGYPIDGPTFIALILIVGASAIYSMNPIMKNDFLPVKSTDTDGK
ncbi:hypothetical protein SARC_03137 [Sphaeroforma arctica JP610]|uniref:UDP-galactose transporter n=1 Tax=Sphaeroforma arctica JP610 TaxID=667725 RepID=A0A0L0G708_9EUKA|nr:hypothetical protein SARC_03137 [Sphaeroforma arctica JP610]KNC84646.1 hypothetical protein SARC_03137 [Sphaeroforma arctica JP610]|eukprot:XP_014158548.1 hypothetical protein SARC_03137 [Sphaeroforma arctica JP610]